MQANRLQRQQGAEGIQGIEQAELAPDGQLVAAMAGQPMDVAALGVKSDLVGRTQAVGIVTGLLNTARDSAQRVIDSIAP